MLGRGKQSGMVNEATNQLTNERLTAAVEEMQSKEYQKMREKDTTDVIPTHRHLVKKKQELTGDEHLEVFTNEKKNKDVDVDDASEGSDDDGELAAIRASRIKSIKKEQDKMVEWRQKQHGTYREIGQDDFFATVVRDKGGSEKAVVHFYHPDFERCKIMDRHIGDIARADMSTKYVKVNVASSPFLVEKLKITVLPCLVIFFKDVAIDRVLGFEDFGDEDVDPDMLRTRIETAFRNKEGEEPSAMVSAAF